MRGEEPTGEPPAGPGGQSPATPEQAGAATAVVDTKADEEAPGASFGQVLRESLLEGNSFTVTVLAIFTALVVGGLINAFTNTTVLHAWGRLFSAPGHAFAEAWDTAVSAYVALFDVSIFNPHTVASLFQQASISAAIHDGFPSAAFNPLSETCVSPPPPLLVALA